MDLQELAQVALDSGDPPRCGKCIYFSPKKHSGCVNFEAEHEQDRVTAQTLVIMCQCKSYSTYRPQAQISIFDVEGV